MIGASVSSSGGIGIVIVQSLAGGTFIYLAACDFIIHEFHNGKDIATGDIRMQSEKNKTQRCINMIKFLFVALGFIIITVLFSLGAKHEH